MGVFGRAAPPPGQPEPTRTPLRVLRADGQRIDLTKRDAGQLLTATRQAWAAQAFDYRDLIGELRYAIRLLSRSVAKVRFYAAEQRPWPEDPVPLDGNDHNLDALLAADAVYNFARLPMDSNPDGFTARLVENLSIAGEAWVHLDPDEQFWVRSVSEITAAADGRVTLAGLPNTTHGSRLIDPRTEDLMRCWVPHPEWAQLADSPMRSLLHTCEDVVIAGREQRAAARSRIAANGILLMPDTLSMPRVRETDDDGDYPDESVLSDTFMADLAEAMLEPIRNEGDAGAVVPLVLRGNKDDIAAVKHLTLERADSEELIARQSAAILRLLKGLDVQPEQVDGVGAMNHWGSWSLDARSIRDQVRPMADTVAACLAAAYLRPAMRAVPGHEHDPDQVRRVTIGVDVSPLTENPNRSQDAMDAHGAGVISDEALRKAKGFDDDDAPSDDEKVERLARDGRLPVDVSAQILGLTRPEREQITVQGQTVQPALPAGPTTAERPAALPGETSPARPVPAEPTGPVVAAAAPTEGWRVDVDACRRLADIDAALTERVTVAADAALQRVLERAGARVRTAARNNTTVTASISGVDVHLIPATLGRDQVESFASVADLIADSYDRFHTQVDAWLADAAEQAADTVCAVLGLTDTARGRAVHATIVSRLAATAARAWPILAAELDAAAEDALFPTIADPELGEAAAGLLFPDAVTEALAAAGGEQPALTAAGYGGGRRRRKRRPVKRPAGTAPTTGPATGPVVRDVIAEQGGMVLGWEWQYRPEILRGTFDPHKQLDGARFTSWRDPLLATDPTTAWVGTHFHPRDHQACRCTATPVIGTVDAPESVMAQALRDAHGDPARVLFGGTTDTRPGQPPSSATALRDRARAALDAMRDEHIGRRR